MESERMLVTVRTYPSPSSSYKETVCVGAISRDGAWRRLYPVRLRYLPESQQFRVWDVIDLRVTPGRDGRPETRRPHLPSLQIVDYLRNWSARLQWINQTILPSLASLRANGGSLGSIHVEKVLGFEAKPDISEWDPVRRAKLDQTMLFEKTLPLEKIPFRFRLRWRDMDRTEHDSLVISWEMAQT